MKNLFIAVAVLVSCYFLYGKYFSNSIEGDWVLDLESGAETLRKMGATEEVINSTMGTVEAKTSYMNISRDEIDIKMLGVHDKFSYEIKSKSNGCYIVHWQSMNENFKYCVRDKKLFFYDEAGKLLGLFKHRS